MTDDVAADDAVDPRDAPGVEVEVEQDATAAARRAAEHVAAALRAGVEARGRATLAVSGGSTPGPMFDALVGAALDWTRIEVLQVDERVAPDGHAERNLGMLTERLLDPAGVPAGNRHPMPVAAHGVTVAAASYATVLRRLAGDPPVLDAVHLGLGDDGHTASLVPGDGLVDEQDPPPVAVSDRYQGRRRLTLTAPVLRHARCQVWLVAGSTKAAAVQRLLRGDPTIPASRVLAPGARVVLDRSASATR